MPRTIRYTLLSLRELIVSAGPFILLAFGLLALAYWWLDPIPPERVRLATGPAQSAYAEFGTRYQKALAASGIEVVLLPSQGSSDNLRMVQQGQADLGFVQGGSRKPAQDDGTAPVSLGDLFVEPVWLFYREEAARKLSASATLSSLGEARGLRINVGTPGSGVPQLMASLFELNKMEPDSVRLSRLGQTDATVAFLDGSIDALVFASAPESLMVQMLLQTPGVKLMDFAQNEAYSRRLPFLAPVTLPRGVVDLATDVPPADVHLVATTTTLLAAPDLHPAAAAIVLASIAGDARRRRLVQPLARIPAGGECRIRAGQGGGTHHPQRCAAVAALPALSAGQSARAHVVVAGHHPGAVAAAVAHCSAAVRVPHPLTRVPLVRAVARHRRPRHRACRAPYPSCCRSSTSSNRASARW